MPPHAATVAAPPPTATPQPPRSDWATLAKLLPYLWRYRWRVGIALGFMVAAKVANVSVPVLLKHLIDSLSIKPGTAASLLVVPVGLLVAYGALRLSTSLFTELRELIFAKATEGTARSISLQVFGHLHSLSLRFHLERQTGGVSRDIERGSKAIHSLLNYTIYNILPTLVEMALVISLLSAKFDGWFAAITLSALALYIAFTVSVTEWRTHFRRAMNEQDSKASTRAVDALLNYETVKVFGNEAFERSRYDENLQRLDLNAIETALVVGQMLDDTTADILADQGAEGDVKHTVLVAAQIAAVKRIAGRMGKPERWVRDQLFLHDLDKTTRQLVIDGRLPVRHARELAKMADPEEIGRAHV